MICAFLLLYLNEEEAFHCLCTICEKVVPGYYQENLWGIKLDQQVMDVFLRRYLPEVAAHIQTHIGGALLVCFEWFMCFFGRCLSLDLATCVFDWVLLDGPRALFVISLAILKYLEDDILQLTSGTELIDKVKHTLLESITHDNILPVRNALYVTLFI